MDPHVTETSGFVYQAQGWERVREILSSLRYLFGGIFVVVPIGGLALSLTLSQHQQNIQQHASSGTALEGQGVYNSCGPTCFSHLDMFSHVGLTFVLDYSMWGRNTTPEQVQAYAERAAADHIKIIWSLKDMWTDKWTTFSGYTNLIAHCNCHDKIELARYIVGLVKDYPATWGYYVADEPHAVDYTAVANLSNAIHQADPNHPRLIVKDDALSNGNAGNVPGGILQYSSLAEVFAEDYYPVSYRQNINSTGPIAGALQTTVNSKGKQSGMVLEVNSGNADGLHATAYPSISQMQSMLHQVLQNSQPRLILWYWYPGTSQQQWINLLTALHPNTFYGGCTGVNGTSGVCSTNPNLGIVQYQGKAAATQCAINATNANAPRNQVVYCCAAGSAQYGACTGRNGSGKDFCRTSCSSSNIDYTDYAAGDQCSINATKAGLARGTAIYCMCVGENCPSSPTATPTPTPTSKPSNTPTPTAKPSESLTPTPTGTPSDTPIPMEGAMNPDINRDGFVNITDYQILMMCYGNKFNTSYCPAAAHPDINDDGVVDGIDYNILLRAMTSGQ